MASLNVLMLVSSVIAIVHFDHTNTQADSKRLLVDDPDVLHLLFVLQKKVQTLEEKVIQLEAGNQSSSQTVAFYAHMAQHNQNLANTSIVTFPTVVTNKGGGYDQHTSIFKAPVGGVYHFTMDLMSHWKEDLEVAMVKNGVVMANAYVGSGSGYGLGTRSSVLKLNTGDDVWVRILTSGHNDGNIRLYGFGWSTFSGFLIGQ